MPFSNFSFQPSTCFNQSILRNELLAERQKVQVEERRRKEAENELLNIMKGVPDSEDGFEVINVSSLYNLL